MIPTKRNEVTLRNFDILHSLIAVVPVCARGRWERNVVNLRACLDFAQDAKKGISAYTCEYQISSICSKSFKNLELLKGLSERLKRVKKILVDGGYKGSFVEAGEKLGIEVEISSQPETSKGFVPLKWRWVSERTFGWFNFNRRLDKEREKTTQSSENWIKWANIKLIINRLEYWQD